MTIKDLLPVLPRYDDNSGYEVTIIFHDGKHLLALCDKVLLNQALEQNKYYPNILEKQVIKILPGITRAGGHFDENLQIIIEK